MAFGCVGQLQGLIGWTDADIEGVFGHIDADKDGCGGLFVAGLL